MEVIKTKELKVLEVETINLNQQMVSDDQILSDEIIKSHFEIIVLSMLSERSMSGYDIIKEIFTHYNVLFSQGTIYPLLYTLKKDGVIQTMPTKGDMRTKRYFLTPDGRLNTHKKIIDFISSMEYFLISIKQGTYVRKLPYTVE